MQDLVQPPTNPPAVPEVHQLPLELADERLHLWDPLLPVPADPVQPPLRREPDAFVDQGELLRAAAPAPDELVDLAPRRVHEGRGGAPDQVAGGQEVGAPRGQAGPRGIRGTCPATPDRRRARSGSPRPACPASVTSTPRPPQSFAYHPSRWSGSFSFPP